MPFFELNTSFFDDFAREREEMVKHQLERRDTSKGVVTPLKAEAADGMPETFPFGL